MRIRKNETSAVVIDMQERLFPHIHDNYELENHVIPLLNGLEILEIPTLITQQYTKGLGPTIAAISETLDNFTHIEKMTFSCCGEPAFMQALEKQGTRNVILLGIEAHVCVLQTALDLVEAGYQPVIVEDCVSSRKERDKNTAIERMRGEGCIITSYESLLFELCVVAGTDTFRQISRLVK